MTAQVSGKYSLPINDSVLNENGTMTPAWVQALQKVADLSATSSQVAALSTTAGAATTAATAATSTASAASASAAATAAAMALILSTPQLWVIGDYRQTSKSSLGTGWLPCDGSDLSNTTYPNLYTILISITGPGGSAGTFKAPSIPDYTHIGDTGAVMRTFIKGL